MIAGDRSSLSEEDTAWYRIGGVSPHAGDLRPHITVPCDGALRLLTFLHLDYRAAAAGRRFLFPSSGRDRTFRRDGPGGHHVSLHLMGAKLAKRTYDLPTAAAFTQPKALLILDNPYYFFTAVLSSSFGAVLCLHVFTERSRFAGGVILALLMMPAVLWFFYEFRFWASTVNLASCPSCRSCSFWEEPKGFSGQRLCPARRSFSSGDPAASRPLRRSSLGFPDPQ